MKFLFLLLASNLVFAAVPQTEGELISMAVGSVSDHIVTSREVHANYIVERVLFAKKSLALPKKLQPVASKEFSRQVTGVLIEWVVYQESKGFPVSKVDASEIKAAISGFNSKVKNSKIWKSLKITDNELEAFITRKLQAKNFTKFKVTSSKVPITDDEARSYFAKKRQEFGDLPFENFKENIKLVLGREQVNQRLQDWFEVLQSKYKVRNFLTEL